MNAWDENECAKRNGARERDDDARVFDGELQEVSNQEHSATLLIDRLCSFTYRVAYGREFFLFNLAKVSASARDFPVSPCNLGRRRAS